MGGEEADGACTDDSRRAAAFEIVAEDAVATNGGGFQKRGLFEAAISAEFHGVTGGNDDVFRHAAEDARADERVVFAEGKVSESAIWTVEAWDERRAGDVVADGDIFHIIRDFNDFARKFMSENDWKEMRGATENARYVRTADAACADVDFHTARPDFRRGAFFVSDVLRGMENGGFHIG